MGLVYLSLWMVISMVNVSKYTYMDPTGRKTQPKWLPKDKAARLINHDVWKIMLVIYLGSS